jgi:TRAP-type mannitol/chloroaromatic compound transport system permease large subunit
VATLSIYRGVIPFVCIQLIGLSLVIYQPEMGLWLPRLI